MAGGTPDTYSRAIPSAWTTMDSGANIQEALEALETYKKKDGAKGTQQTYVLPPNRLTHGPIVVVRFKAVGNAPIMKQNLYKITASNRFQAVIQFLRKELGWKAGDALVRRPQSYIDQT